MGTIAVATSKQAEVIAFDAGELGRVLQRIAAVGTCGKFYVVHDVLRPTSLDGKVTPCPIFHSRKTQSWTSVTTTARSSRAAREDCEYRNRTMVSLLSADKTTLVSPLALLGK